jgi:hypothetical protein
MTIAAFAIIVAEAVLGLEVTDHRFDRGAAPHLAADRPGAPRPAADPDAELVR